MPAWFRKGDDPDDEPTGQIAAVGLTQIIEDVDGKPAEEAVGTESVKTASEPDVYPVPVIATGTDLERALAERQALIQLCLYAMDRAKSSGVVERLEQGLAAIGVQALRPDGEKFDPAVHEAGSAMPTDHVELDGKVAETEVAGFVDRERLLRAPIVTVYTKRTS